MSIAVLISFYKFIQTQLHLTHFIKALPGLCSVEGMFAFSILKIKATNYFTCLEKMCHIGSFDKEYTNE